MSDVIRLFRPTETDFSHNEWCLTEIISCTVIEELNGDYTLKLEYPLEDSKGISANLIRGAILCVPTIDNRDNQLFRIIKTDKTETTIMVEAQAKLLSDLKSNWCTPMTIIGKTRKEAIAQILDSCLDPHDYSTGSLDKNTNKSVLINAEAGNPLSNIIGDNDNSVIKNYGGEFIVDNSTIDIVDRRGENNGVVIEYGKNITGITETIDDTDLATVLIPKSGDYYLPEYYIESDNVNKYEKRFFLEVDMNLNIWDGDGEQGDDQITKKEAYKIMRQTCKDMFNEDKVDQLSFNYEIDFVELSRTEEYKQYKCLETVNIGDTVTVKHKKLDINLEGRVNKIEYEIDSQGRTKINNIEVGFTKKDLIDVINTTIRQISITEQKILLRVQNATNTLYSEIEMTATQIRSEVVDVENGLNSKITQTATQIRSEVTDTKNNLQSQITQNAREIATKVSDDEFNSEIRQLSNEISSKVSEDDFSSMITQNSRSVTVAIKDESDHNVIINNNGLTVQNGAFALEDSSGNKIMDVDTDGIIRADVIGVNDIVISNTGKTSGLYKALRDMDEISTGEIKPSRLTLDDDEFYINSDGWTLREYVERLIDGRNV